MRLLKGACKIISRKSVSTIWLLRRAPDRPGILSVTGGFSTALLVVAISDPPSRFVTFKEQFTAVAR